MTRPRLPRLSTRTGLSVGTLSRVESGQRRPTLELLLPLARAYAVPLDDLVGAPPTGDPRVYAGPISRRGQTYIPLTRYRGGLSAYKQIIPARPSTKDTRLRQQTYEGSEWLYVLAGKVWLALGEQDIILPPGEGAEFDTRLPHGSGNPGEIPAEFLSLFGHRANGFISGHGHRVSDGRVLCPYRPHADDRNPAHHAGVRSLGVRPHHSL